MSQRANIFTRIFGDSLITPIKDHMSVCHETAKLLTPFFTEVFNDDFDAAHQIHLRINELEHKADTQKKEIRLHLPTGLLMAVPRSDLLELVRAQDKIANGTRDVAGLVCGRAIRIPSSLKENFDRLIEQAVGAAAALDETLHSLDTLVGSGFIQTRTRAIEAGVDLVDQRERLADDCERELRIKLFEIEDSFDPIDVMFLYTVIDQIGEVADRAQMVANRIRIIIAA